MIRISCSTLSFDGFGDNDFVNTFDKAAQAGYRYIEFNLWHPSGLTPLKIADIASRCEKSGLEAASIHISAIGGADNHGISKDVCHKIRAIDAARELGCSRVVFSGSHPRGADGAINAALIVLREIMPYAEEKNVMICVENHESNTIENISDYEEIFNKIDSANIGMCIDTGHFDAAGVDINRVIDIFADKINHIHLKENNGFGDKNFCHFGCGTTDNINAVKRMIEAGYSGYLDIEVSPEIGDMPFNIENVIKPMKMFKTFETNEKTGGVL